MKLLEQYPELSEVYGRYVSLDATEVCLWFDEAGLETIQPSTYVSPWPLTWIEYPCPNIIRKGDVIKLSNIRREFTRIACAYHTVEVAEGDSDRVRKENAAKKTLQRLSADPAYNRYAKIEEAGFRGECRWMVTNRVFAEVFGRVVLAGGFCAYLDREGGLLPGVSLECFVDGRADIPEQIMLSFSWPTLVAISLAHCKNVQIVDIVQPRYVRRRLEKAGASVTYKTLLIGPFKKQMRHEADNDPAGEQSTIKRALHICRGHFSTYSEERPLFGKHAGTFWIPMHVKGNKQHGEVKKDYKIVTP